MEESLIARLSKRAAIRRQIQTRKSVQEGKPDRIADLLEEAASELICNDTYIRALQQENKELRRDGNSDNKLKDFPNGVRVVCAANRYTVLIPETGDEYFVVTGARHYDTWMHQQIDAIDEYFWSCKKTEEQGFIDNRGNFLSREDAWVLAKQNNQILRRVGGDEFTDEDGTIHNRLYSENLY